jgi:CRP-like cAMP-binding protein
MIKHLSSTCEACIVRDECICKHLPPESKSLVEKTKKIRWAVKGGVVAREYTPVTEVMTVLEGIMCCVKDGQNKNECITDFLTPGMGTEIPPQASKRYTYSLEAITPIAYCALPLDLVQGLLVKHALIDYILELGHERYLRCLQRMHDSNTMQAREKVICLLKTVNKDAASAVVLTHTDMARLACMTRETVARTLSALRKDKWLRLEEGKIFLAKTN